MIITVKYNEQIGNYKAYEKTESFYADTMWEAPGTSLIYFRTGYVIKSFSKSEIVSIKHK